VIVCVPGAKTPVDHSATPDAFSGCVELVVAVPCVSVKTTDPVAAVG